MHVKPVMKHITAGYLLDILTLALGMCHRDVSVLPRPPYRKYFTECCTSALARVKNYGTLLRKHALYFEQNSGVTC